MAKAILFGDLRPDGRIRVWRTIHSHPNKEELKIEDHPDGYAFEKLPDPPVGKRGIEHIMLFNPDTKEFEWEEQERQLNDTEVQELHLETMVENNRLLSELISELKKNK